MFFIFVILIYIFEYASYVDCDSLHRAEFYYSIRRFSTNCEKRLLASYMSVCLSVCPLGSARLPQKGLSWNLILRIFRKAVEKFKFQVKFDKNNEHVARTPIYIFDHIAINSS